MRPRLFAPALLVLLALVLLWPAEAWAQSAVRIFGTNAAGEAIPIQAAADGTIKLTLAVSGYEFEGATEDAFETSLVVVDPTADQTITFPDATGTVALVENTLAVFAATTSAQLAGVLSNETGTGVVVFGTAPTFTTSIAVGAAGVKLSDDGDGAITFLGLGDGSDEALTLNLDDTADTGTFTSSTGLATLNFTSIALQESGVGVLNADEIDASSELLAIVDDETGTGALVFGTSPIFTTAATAGLIASQDVIKFLPVTDDDRFTATLTVADLASDQTYTLPVTGGTFAVTVDKLSAFAATTSAELLGVVSDETGSGLAVFATSPSFTTSIAVVGGGDTVTTTAAAGTITAAATGGSENISFVFTPKGTGQTTLTGGITGGCTGTPTAATAGVSTTCTGPEAAPDVLLEQLRDLQARLAALEHR